MNADPSLALELMARIAAMGIALQSLEVLRNAGELREGRLFGWSRPVSGSWWRALRAWPQVYPACAGLVGLRALLATLIAIGLVAASWGPLALLTGLQLFYNRRFTIIAGACETMFLVCLTAALVGVLPGATPRLRIAALVFVTLQVAIAYAAAGVDKLRSPGWRSGQRLLQVMRDSSYRLPRLARELEARPRGARGLAWSILALELMLPFAVLLPPAVCASLLVAGFTFHAVIAATMGLHGFWWSFTASYVAVWQVNALLWTRTGG